MGQFKGKAIYNPSGKAGEYAEWACNFYAGCSNGCEYCYLIKGWSAKTYEHRYPKLKAHFKDEAHALEVFERELIQNLEELRKHGLFFSFTTDPLLPETIDLTIRAVNIAVDNNVPCKILTKCAWWAEGARLSSLITTGESFKKLVSFGFTLTGHDEMELGASTNAIRIAVMRILHNAGFKTFASIEPIIDFPTAKRMIEFTLGTCDFYKIGLMAGQNYSLPEVREFVEWLRSINPAPAIYLKERLQKMSGYASPGNMELIANARPLEANFVDRDYNIFNFK